jgi:hypothetical protein
MNQTDDTKQKFISDESQAEATPDAEIAGNQAAQEKSEEIDNLPIESAGSYGRIDESPGEESKGSTDYSPSES